MNKTFRSLWSVAKQAWVAVAETVRACGKACSSSRQVSRAAALLGGLWAAGAVAQTAPPPTALPTGGQLSAGQASISQSGASMVIQQGSERAAINWQSFNVGSQAQVQFQQPSASSVTLNRVLSADPSQIFGRITANGQVILTNPQGVYFGRDARVDVGGLIATTNSISDADFMAGKSRFERQGSTGRVVNEGELKAALGGYIALLAPEVRNQGAIIAQMGTVALAAGEAVDLKFDSHNRLTGLRVEPSLIQALVDNRHAVQAPGGLIILSAQSLDRLVGGVVRNSGRIEAQGLQQQGGRIILSASRRVENTGTLSANASASSAASEGGPAGKIEISAPEVLNTGTISATGVVQQAGGSVRIEVAQFTQAEAGRIDLSAPQKGGSLSIQASGSVQLQGRVDVSATHDAPATSPATSPVVEAGISSVTTPVVETASSPGTQGGHVEVLAQGDIELREAVLDASGGQGGTIHLGAASAAQPDKPHPVPDVPGQGRLALMGHSTLSTRGRRGQGGSTTLLGDHLSLNDRTQIDAAGATGGGTVRVGGDWQGTNGVYQASTLTMGSEVLINASAMVRGDGGTVVLWSDIHRRGGLTAVHGTVWARGGVLGGQGGRVETSGHAVELEGVRINAGADRGLGGRWLIDPYNYTIDSAAAASIVGTASSGLNSGTSVEVSTSTSNTSYGGSTNSADLGDITVSANISKTLGGDATLTLRAARDIRINSGVQISSTSNKLNLVLIADDDNANNGAIYLDGSSSRVTLTTNGGHVWMGGNGWGTANGSTSWNGLSVGTGWAGSAGTTLISEGANLNNTGVTTAGGEVYMAGRSNRYQSGESRYGVLIQNSSDINTAGGHLTVKGELQALSGTLATYPVMYGVAVNSSTLQTSTGSISLTGGEAALDISAGSGGHGVHLYNSTVKTTGATGGGITITGTTGVHSHDNNERVGVSLRAYGPNAATVVSTVAGGISISGTSNNTSTNQSGVRLSTAKPLNDDVSHPSVQVVSRTGHITLQGDVPSATSTDNSGIQFNGSNWGKFWMGFDGTNSYSGNLTLSGRSVSDSNVASGYLNMGGSGALTIESRGNSFVVGASTAATFTLGSAYTLGSSHSAITLGKSTNTSNIAINSALSAAGPISLYGGDINLSANLASSQTNAAILLKAAGNITQGSSTQVSSSGGSVTYWSDSDGSGAGAIQLNAGTSTTSTSISTSGGDIVLGGGSSNPLSGYALNPGSHGVNLNSYTNLNAGAGAVSLRGSSSVTGSAYGIGVRIFGASISGGNVSLTGVGSSNASSNGFNWGVSFEGGGAVTASGTLSITGNGGGGGSTGSNNYGVLISASTASGTGSGAVAITGTGGGKSAGGTDNDGIRIENGATIRSASGSLTLVGTAGLNASSEGLAIQGSGTNTLGAASGQSGHITLRANSLTAGTANTNQVLGTGTLTIEPLSGSSSFDGGGFTTSGWTFGSTLTGLTLGKSGNNATLTVAANYGASIAGPISLYGGDINLSANLASSQTNAAILLKASGNILQNGGYDVTSTGGHITYWADSDGNSAGLIQVDAGTSVNTTSIASGGGNIVMGGGASDPLVGDATGSASSYNGVSLDDWTSVNAGAGAVSLRGTSLTTATSFGIGVRLYGNASVSGGNVTLDGRGGPGSGAFTHNYGVTVDNGASVTASGTLGITGVGGGSGSTGGISPGVFIRNATISGTGSGALTLRGTGGGKSGAGTGNYGIRIENNATIKSAGGSLTLEGTAGFNASSEGIAIQGSGTNTLGAASGQSGHITLRANSFTASTSNTNQVLGTGTLTIEPLSASTSFDSGGFSTSGWTLGTALTGLTLGKSGNTAALTVAASYGANIAGPITLIGGAVTLNTGLTTTNGSTGDVAITTTGLAGSGGLTLATGRGLTVTQSGASTYSGVISGTSARFTKQGAGTLTLDGNSSYTGSTTLSAGVLKLGATGSGGNSPVGTAAGGTTVASGAALDLAGYTLAVAEPLSLSGTGVSSSGALFNSSTAVTYSGPITLAANSSIQGGSGALTLSGTVNGAFTLDVGTNNANFTQSGVVGGTSAPTGYTVNAGTGTVNNNAALTAAGPISLYGGDINLSANLASSQTNAAILLKAAGNITQGSSTQVSSSGGSVTYWSDSDGSGAGAIQLNAGTSTTSTSISTSGGDIVMGGGNADPLAGDAVSTVGQGLNLNSQTSLNAGSGAVSLRGRSSITGGAYGIGVRAFGASITGGNVSLTGVGASNASSNGLNWGVSLEGVTVSASGTLSITGTGGGGGSTGATNHGVLISGSTASGTGSGAVTITGTGGGKSAGGTDNDGIRIESGGAVRSASGSLTLVGTAGLNASSEGLAIQGSGTNTLGAASGQSGNIALRANSFTASTGSTNQVLGTGTLTIEPLSGSTSFDSGGFSTSGWTLGTALTGLTLGKSGNTAALTVAASYGVNIAGPITLHGGAVTLNAGLTTTNGTTGDVAITSTGLTGSGGLTLATGRGLTVTQSGASTYSGVISGSTARFTKAGAGTLTVDGNSTYTGSTTLSAGTLQVGAGGTEGALGSGSITNDATLVFNRSDDISLSQAMSGSGALTKEGSNTLTLTANGSYTGATTVSGGTLVLSNNAPSTASSGFSGAGALRIQPTGNDFSSAFSTSGWTWGATLGGLTIGKASSADGSADTNLSVASAIHIAGPITLYGGGLSLNGALNAGSGGNNISLHASGAVTQSAALSASALDLQGAGSFTLAHASNNVASLTAGSSTARTGAVSFLDASSMQLGSVWSADDVFVRTASGDLTLAGSVSTTSPSGAALRLAAGTSAAAGGSGSSATGNIVVTGSPTLSAGTGGTMALYSGSVSGSTGLSSLVGSATGRFRYNTSINASGTVTAGFTTALGSDVVQALYREQPSVTGTVSNASMSYGDTVPSFSLAGATGLVNGDTASSFGVLSPLYSGANQLRVGTYGVQASSLSALGYQTSSVTNGSLSVGTKTLTVSGLTASSKAYDGSTTASLSAAGSLVGGLANDALALSTSASFNSANVELSKTLNLSHTLSGADAANYALSNQTGVATSALITPRTVGLSASKVYEGTTGLTGAVTITTGVGSQTLSYTGAVASDAHVATSGKFISALTLADGTGGGLAANYQLPTLNAANAPVTITAATLTPTLTNTGVTKVYDGTTTAPAGFNPSWSISGLVSGDTAASLSATGVAFNAASVAGANSLAVSGLSIAGITGSRSSQASDYVLDATTKSVAASITRAPLSVTADAKSRFYGDANPSFTQTITGYVNGENASTAGVSGTASASSAATDQSAVGSYTIVASTGSLAAANYSFAPVNGTLTVTDRPIAVSADPSQAHMVAADLTGTRRSLALPEAGVPAPLVGPDAAAVARAASLSPQAVIGGGPGVSFELQLVNEAEEPPLVLAVNLPPGQALAGTDILLPLPPSVSALARQGARIQASRPDGSPLPAWLRFDPAQLRLALSAEPDQALPLKLTLAVGARRLAVLVRVHPK